MPQPADRIVVGVGELLWDCFPGGRRPGGAPANVAFHAQQLGNRGVVVSRVGDDADGRELTSELERRGLDTTRIQLDPTHPTGRVSVDASDPGRPSYTIHTGVAWDALDFDADVERLMQDAAAVCVGSLAQRSPASRETIGRCLEAAGTDALRVFDVNLRPGGYEADWIRATLERSEVVKLNEDEVPVVAGLLGLAANSEERFARALLDRLGLELVCVTRAERGCSLFGAGETVHAPGREITLVDAVGAGDAFTAALITARLRGLPLERTARLANDVGALVAARDGAMPELPEILNEMLEAER